MHGPMNIKYENEILRISRQGPRTHSSATVSESKPTAPYTLSEPRTWSSRFIFILHKWHDTISQRSYSIVSPPCANSRKKRRRLSRHSCHSSNCCCFKSGRQRPILTKVSRVFRHFIKTNSGTVTLNRQRSSIPSVFLPPDHSQLIYHVLFDTTSQQSHVTKQLN